MANFANVIKKFRDIFNIAADIKDSEINKVIQEADKLDIKQGLCGDTFIRVPASFGGGLDGGDIPDSSTSDDAYSLTVDVGEESYEIVPLSTILCYYAFARYVKDADQKSTSTGFKIPGYSASVIVPDNSKSRRYEAEKGKADAFLEDFHTVYEKYKESIKPQENECCKPQKYRICFIN